LPPSSSVFRSARARAGRATRRAQSRARGLGL
jgi:hypothetical protein